jgi:protease IV
MGTMIPILKDILTSDWLIHNERKDVYAALLLSLLKGERISMHEDDNEDAENSENRSKNRSYVISKSLVGRDQRISLRDAQIPEGSIAVIPIRDEIFKYDQMCGPRGSMSILDDLKLAESNMNIKSILLVVDSPGGQVSYTDILADAVKNCGKPVIGYVEGMAASAAYWIVSGCTKIIASSELDRVGSIGTMLYFADLQPYYEKEGVVFHEVYATLSKDKNKDINDLLDGKYDDYRKNTLDRINQKFLSGVKENRPSLSASTLTGKIFFAPDAIQLGLIDEIGTMEYAIEQADNTEVPEEIPAPGSTPDPDSEPENKNSKTDTMKLGTKLTAIFSLLFGKEETAEEKELTTENLETLNGKVKELQDANSKLTTDLQTAKTDLIEVTGKYNKLKNEDAAEETTAGKDKDKIEGDDEDPSAGFKHNQVADSVAPGAK